MTNNIKRDDGSSAVISIDRENLHKYTLEKKKLLRIKVLEAEVKELKDELLALKTLVEENLQRS